MMHRPAICLVFASSLLGAPRIVAADATIQVVFATVDSVEIKDHDVCSGCGVHALVVIRGIPVGGSGPSTGFSTSPRTPPWRRDANISP